MDWKVFAQLLVTFIVAAGGWWAGHWFTARRDLANERRKTITVFLLDAYRRLEAGSNRNQESWKEFRRSIESAISDIQLLGSSHQAALARQFAADLARGSGASTYGLLFNLRETLRQELELTPVTDPIKSLRFVDDGLGSAEGSSDDSHP